MARRKTSRAFGIWVRQARAATRMSQRALAAKAELTQQDWSKIESGQVPDDRTMRKVCDVLERPFEEALRVITESAAFDDRRQTYALEFDAFTTSLANRAKHTRRLDVYVIRADTEPFLEPAAAYHLTILAEIRNLHVSILFRHSDLPTWESFRLLATTIMRLQAAHMPSLPSTDQLSDLPTRLRGYYRNSEWEENRTKELPLGHPIILIADDKQPPYLCYYDVDHILYERARASGADHSTAEHSSLVLLRGRQDNAQLFAGWIGTRTNTGLDPALWHSIPWPDAPEPLPTSSDIRYSSQRRSPRPTALPSGPTRHT